MSIGITEMCSHDVEARVSLTGPLRWCPSAGAAERTNHERTTSPLRLSSSWVTAPSGVLLLMVAAGFLTWSLAIVSGRARPDDTKAQG